MESQINSVSTSVQVAIANRDHIQWMRKPDGSESFHLKVCWDCHLLLKELRSSQLPVAQWPLPKGHSHSELLLKELILKVKGEWNPPYTQDEICHCRGVPTAKVVEAIHAGAHTSDRISRWTSASTACGTCRPDVISLLQYIVEK